MRRSRHQLCVRYNVPQLTNRFSGYGRVGAFWSLRWHSTYTVDNLRNEEKRACGKWDYDTLEQLALGSIVGGEDDESVIGFRAQYDKSASAKSFLHAFAAWHPGV